MNDPDDADSQAASAPAPAPPSDPAVRSGSRLALAALALLALAGFLLSRSLPSTVTIEAATIPSASGEAIPVLWVSPAERRGTALLAHGITASKETLVPIAEALALNGIECCVVDLPRHGDSDLPLDRATLDAVFQAGERALRERSGGAPLDLFAAHSFGAATAASAISRGAFLPRVFVAIGARPRFTRRPHTVVLVRGRFEELISDAEADADARRLNATAVVAPWSDHALEPFDPAVAQATVEAVTGRPAKTDTHAWLRLGGVVLLIVSTVLFVGLLPRPPLDSRRREVGAGLLAAAAVLTPAVVGLHGHWLFLAPTPQRAALAVAVSAGAFLICFGLHHAAKRIERPTWAIYPFLASLAIVPALGFAVQGLRFPALVLGLLALHLALSAGVGLLVRWRLRSDLAGLVACAGVLGYVPGVWFGGAL